MTGYLLKVILLACLFILVSCGSSPRQAYTYSSDSRVGLMTLIGSDFRYARRSVFVWDQKDYPVDWNLGKRVKEKFIEASGTVVTELDAPAAFVGKNGSELSELINGPDLSVRDEIASLCQNNNLDVIVVLGEHTMWFTQYPPATDLSGYGVYTVFLTFSRKAFSYFNGYFATIHCNPVDYRLWGGAHMPTREKGFTDADSVDELSPEAIASLRSSVESEAKQFAVHAAEQLLMLLNNSR